MSIAISKTNRNKKYGPKNSQHKKKSKIKYSKRQTKFNKQKRTINDSKKKKEYKRLESKAKRAERKVEQERSIINKLSQNMIKWLGEEQINKIARSTGYFIRKGKLLPLAFLITLAFGSYGNGGKLRTLTSCIYSWFKITVTQQAFSNRLDQCKTVKFLKCLMKKALEVQLNLGFQNNYAKIFSHYRAVYIEDSTYFKLAEEVAKFFRGRGGSASSAAVKLNFTVDIKTNTTRNIDVTSGNVPDQKLAKNVLKIMKAGELYIRDLGYFDLTIMLAMINQGVFFISRLQKNVHIYVDKISEVPIILNDFLKEKTKNGETIDQWVYVGEQKVYVRLIAEAVPEDVKQQRAKRYKSERKKEPTEDYIIWSGFSVFITNVPKEIWATACLVMTIYKIRWKIELFFKRLKSIGKIHVINVESKNRVLCEIYGRLIGILTAEIVVSYAHSICDEDQEISEYKLFDWLIEQNRLGCAVKYGKLEDLLIEMVSVFYLHCKDKRKRKSTLDLIKETMCREGISPVDFSPEETGKAVSMLHELKPIPRETLMSEMETNVA
jgi:hypothetical protein